MENVDVRVLVAVTPSPTRSERPKSLRQHRAPGDLMEGHGAVEVDSAAFGFGPPPQGCCWTGSLKPSHEDRDRE